MRWYARGTPPSAEQLALLVRHVEHWREKVPGYGLLVPPERAAGAQLYGELLILERITVRGALPENVATLLDALSELIALIPSVSITVMTDDVVFAETPMGFERRPRRPNDDMLERPEHWRPVTEIAALVLPIRGLGEEASLHAVPLAPPGVASLALRFDDLDLYDDQTAMRHVESISIRAAKAEMLLLVAELRDRPRSDAQQRVFEQGMTALGFARMTESAPTLVLLLEGPRPQSARERDWCELVLRTVTDDERTSDEVAAVGRVLSDGSTSAVLTLSAERRAHLLAHEAEDLESARQDAAAAREWFANNRERIEELEKLIKHPT
jgi:hypothetical protein